MESSAHKCTVCGQSVRWTGSRWMHVENADTHPAMCLQAKADDTKEYEPLTPAAEMFGKVKELNFAQAHLRRMRLLLKRLQQGSPSSMTHLDQFDRMTLARLEKIVEAVYGNA